MTADLRTPLVHGALLALVASLGGCGAHREELTSLPGELSPPASPTQPPEESCRNLTAQETLPKTPVAQYIFPVIKGFASAKDGAWCVCRDIGSSPHIGQDYNNTVKAQDTSMAISNGVVKSVTSLGTCGYEVMFEDSHGAVWRYLHLNKPNLTAGQKLWRGDLIGTHAAYPKEGCGTGPHLHLERKKPGEHGGALTYNTCPQGGGSKSCNYDPVTLLRDKRVVQDEEDRKRVVKESKGTLSDPSTTPDNDTPTPAPGHSICTACSPSQPVAVQGAEPTATKGTEGMLKGRAGFVRDSEGKKLLVAAASLSASLEANRCDGKSECLVSWEFQVRGADGKWWKLFASRGVQNRPVKLSSEQAYCLTSDLSAQYRIVALSDQRRTYVARGELSDFTEN